MRRRRGRVIVARDENGRLSKSQSWLVTERSSTAFNWNAYSNRCDSLRLLRANRIHVDTEISTEDGYSDCVHMQVLSALCPKLIEAAKQLTISNEGEAKAFKLFHRACFYSSFSSSSWQHLRLPNDIDAQLARQLIECAYGEKVSLDRANLSKFYLVSTKYSIDYAIKICLNYAKSLLDIQNCIQMFLLSLKHRHHKLKQASYSMIRSNFKLILQVNPDFHLIQANHLQRLLLDDLLKLNEDEEYAWLAIVRWAREQLMSPNEFLSIFNEMVTIPAPFSQLAGWHHHHHLLPPTSQSIKSIATHSNDIRANKNIGQSPIGYHQARGFSLNFYSPSVPFDTNGSGNEQSAQCLTTTIAKRNKPNDLLLPMTMGASSAGQKLKDQSRSIYDDYQEKERSKEDKLFELIKCLRFIRFRSLGSFDVMLASDFVQKSEKLTLLVSHMKLRYMLRKKIPIDKDQMRLILPTGGLDKVKLNETTQSKRMLKSMIRFIKCRQLLNTRQALFGQTNALAPADTQHEQQQQQQQHLSSQPESNQLEVENIHHHHEKLMARQQQQDGTLMNHKTTPTTNVNYEFEKQLDAEYLRRADRPRVPTSVALLTGGWHEGRVSKSMLAYDFVCDKWFKLNVRLPEPRAFHASCSSPRTGQIFIFGGTNGEQILNSVIRFDPTLDVNLSSSSSRAADKTPMKRRITKSSQLTYRFHNLTPMRERRCHLSGVFHSNGKLYALGGHNGHQRLRSGEWFDVMSNRWFPIAEMTIARSDASACSHDNKIFIAGGQISDQFIQSSVEFYKPSDNTWTFVSPMIVPRMSFHLVSFRNHLLAMGGANGLMMGDEIGSVTRSVERYNANQSSWSLCTPMTQKRSSFGVMSIEEKLIVVGGFGGRHRLKTCESLRIGRFSSTASSRLNSTTSGLLRAHQLEYEVARPGAAAAAAIKAILNISNNDDNREQIVNQQEGADREETTSQVNDSVASTKEAAPSAAKQPQANNQQARKNLFVGRFVRSVSPLRGAMRWTDRARLPSKRSGFSIAVVNNLKNSKDYTYYGSLKSQNASKSSKVEGATIVKQRSRWHRFKLIKRRKLVKHLKIAVVVTIVILMM